MNPWKTYPVRFCVRDYYWADVKARSEEEAERRVQALYEREGEEPSSSTSATAAPMTGMSRCWRGRAHEHFIVFRGVRHTGMGLARMAMCAGLPRTLPAAEVGAVGIQAAEALLPHALTPARAPRNSPWLVTAELLRWRSCLVLRCIRRCLHVACSSLLALGLANA
jgi:hypothetical protein